MSETRERPRASAWGRLRVAQQSVILTLRLVAALLPDNCERAKGEVQCFEGLCNNQAGIGNETDTQGNTKDDSLDDTGNPQKDLGCAETPSNDRQRQYRRWPVGPMVSRWRPSLRVG
jgi:hypothetical protein